MKHQQTKKKSPQKYNNGLCNRKNVFFWIFVLPFFKWNVFFKKWRFLGKFSENLGQHEIKKSNRKSLIFTVGSYTSMSEKNTIFVDNQTHQGPRGNFYLTTSCVCVCVCDELKPEKRKKNCSFEMDVTANVTLFFPSSIRQTNRNRKARPRTCQKCYLWKRKVEWKLSYKKKNKNFWLLKIFSLTHCIGQSTGSDLLALSMAKNVTCYPV